MPVTSLHAAKSVSTDFTLKSESFRSYVGGGRALPMVTFDHNHTPSTLAHPNPSLSVNEHDAIVGSVRLV